MIMAVAGHLGEVDGTAECVDIVLDRGSRADDADEVQNVGLGRVFGCLSLERGRVEVLPSAG